jgi:SAM-dependent methyltransferase
MNNEQRLLNEVEWHDKVLENGAWQITKKYYSVSEKMDVERVAEIESHLFPDKTVYLDYGCGSGEYTTIMADKIKRGVGIDVSPSLIEAAKRINTKDNLEFFVMNAEKTSFEDGVFDVIYGQSILHHLNLQNALSEIHRILKQDGTAIFKEPLDTNPIIKIYRKLTPKARTPDEQPLRKKDMELIKKMFPNTSVKYYFCLSLFAVPFRNTPLFKMMLDFLFALDKILLNEKSPFRYLAWTSIIKLRK